MHLTFFSNQYEMYRNEYQVDPDLPFLGYREAKQQYDICNFSKEQCEINDEAFVLKCQKVFNQAEEEGSEVMYRCINCQSCKTCKDHDQIDLTGIK